MWNERGGRKKRKASVFEVGLLHILSTCTTTGGVLCLNVGVL